MTVSNVAPSALRSSFAGIHLEVQQVVVAGQAVDLVAPLVRLRGDVLLDGRSALVGDHGFVESEMLRWSEMRGEGGVQLGSE